MSVELDAALRRAAAHTTPSFDRSNGEAPVTDDDLLATWPRRDLGPALAGEIEVVTPTILSRDDGRRLLYPGRTNGLHGQDSVGKSLVALIAADQEMRAGRPVIWIDLEEPNENVAIERLRMLGADDNTIVDHLLYHRPDEFFSTDAVALIADEQAETEASLIVLDSIGEAFGLEGIDENADKEVAPWNRRVLRRLADTGAAVVPIDHGTKAADNPLHPSGSKRKRAAITGASYLVEAPHPLSRERGGRLRLTCAKDRHGHFARGEVAAEVELTVYPDGGATVHVWAPTKPNVNTPDPRLLVIARAAVRAVKDADHALSRRELEALMNVKASAATKRAGIDRAIAAGSIRTEEGPRRSVQHIYVRDLPEEA